jgi:16S rRNA G966 N2-methylase RsmD
MGDPKEIEVNQNFFNLFFPKKEGVDSKNVKISNVGLYSISDYKTADAISLTIKKYLGSDITITDATANVGGNSMSFAKFFKKVNSVEIEKVHCDILKNNLEIYNLDHKTKIYCDNYLEIYKTIDQDVIFIDAPWGGVNYKKKELVDLYLGKKSIGEIVNMIYDKCKLIVLKVPKNFNFKKLNAITNLSSYEMNIHRKKDNRVKFIVVYIKTKKID